MASFWNFVRTPLDFRVNPRGVFTLKFNSKHMESNPGLRGYIIAIRDATTFEL